MTQSKTSLMPAVASTAGNTPEPRIEEWVKKPVKIKAFQWNGREDESGMGLLFKLADPADLPHAPDDPHIRNGYGYTPADGCVTIPTLEGTMTARPGDFIIKGIVGEVYPCKPHIFADSYERVAASSKEATADEKLRNLAKELVAANNDRGRNYDSSPDEIETLEIIKRHLRGEVVK